MKKTFIFKSILILAVLIGLSNLAFSETEQKAVLTECKERMFWRIDGTDENGNPSVLYIQGTIHIGDKRLLKVPGKVMKAFKKADRYVGEISTEEWENSSTIFAAFLKDRIDPERDISKDLSPEALKIYKTLYPLEPMRKRVAALEPWLNNITVLQNVYKLTGLDPAFALDTLFETKIKESGKICEGLDTAELQFKVLSFGTYKEQIKMLEATLKDYPFTDTVELIKSMYEAYLENDKDGLFKALNEEDNQGFEDDTDLAERYHEKIYLERNRAWADKFEGYLKAGGTTFIYAGSAHFLGDESVFSYMKEKGYLE